MLEKPCPARVACAWSIRRPRTSGTSVLLLSPLNTRRVTVLFCGAWAPAAGSVLATSPSLPPSTLVLFTDGISDARNRAGDRLGETKILDVVKKYQASDPEIILEKVFEVLEKHVGRAPQRDDLTMVLLKT